MKRVLTGIQATGKVHLGNYLGAIKPALHFQSNHNCFFFIADIHALNSVHKKDSLVESTLDVAASWIASGFDYKNHLLYRQSDIPSVTELTWYLGVVTGMGLLQRSHVYKDATQKGKEVNFGVFAYPLLMAADILLYDANIVPVGKDQKQHIDIARDVAISFNAIYGDVLILPQATIQNNVMTVPGIDGRKMSKSYGNEIPLFCSENELLKKIRSIKTDSSPLESSKDLKSSLIGELLSFFSSEDEFNEYNLKMLQGGIGWGHAKDHLYEIINQKLTPHRKVYIDLMNDKAQIMTILEDGRNKAKEHASRVLQRIRSAIGYS
jgi:tryptophanyl-tRNA synthetase